MTNHLSYYKRHIVITTLTFLPFFAAAQGNLGDLIGKASRWALLLINFLLVLATLVFLWGIIKYISAGGDAAKVKEARSYILWGIIGLAIMASVWAIVKFVQSNVGVGDDSTIPQDIYEQKGGKISI
jgi:hypothetical protein